LIENLLVRIHFIIEMIWWIIEMIWWTGLALLEFEFPFSESLTSAFLSPRCRTSSTLGHAPTLTASNASLPNAYWNLTPPRTPQNAGVGAIGAGSPEAGRAGPSEAGPSTVGIGPEAGLSAILAGRKGSVLLYAAAEQEVLRRRLVAEDGSKGGHAAGQSSGTPL
jgi:hypothetical protein